MSDQETTTNPAEATEAKKPVTVLGNMPQRSVFDSLDQAAAFYAKCAEEYADFADYPVAAVGLDADDNFDPAVYTEDMRIAISLVTKRAKSDGNPTDETIVHCIAIFPVPKLSAIIGLPEGVELTNKQGVDWLVGIMEKEFNHVAVRSLRKAGDPRAIADAVESMPASILDYITTGSETNSGIVAAYDELWQTIKKGMGKAFKIFALRNFSKKELRKAMESASYARAVYGTLENRTNKDGEPESLFVVAAKLGVMMAHKDQLDPTIFERMLTDRDSYEHSFEEEEDDFDLDAMAASLHAERAKPEA